MKEFRPAITFLYTGVKSTLLEFLSFAAFIDLVLIFHTEIRKQLLGKFILLITIETGFFVKFKKIIILLNIYVIVIF